MRLPFRRKDKDKDKDKGRNGAHGIGPADLCPSYDGILPTAPPTARSARLLARLPPNVMERIFSFVCPHSTDETYETCEGSANDSGCSLCDLRDLSFCIKVNRSWRPPALRML